MSDVVLLKKALLILGLESELYRYIEITDLVDDLLLLNHIKPLRNSLVKEITGVVVDLLSENVLIYPKYHLEVSIQNTINVINDRFLLNQQSGNSVIVKDRYRFYEYNQGIEMTILYNRGEVYWVTQDKINCNKHLLLYYECGGIDIDELDMEEIYNIKIVHPSLLTVNKANVGKGYIVDNIGNMGDIIKDIDDNNEGVIYNYKKLSLNEANDFLDTGYYDRDGILGDGESVVMYWENKLYHVKSKAYRYREDIYINASNEDDMYQCFLRALVPRVQFDKIYYNLKVGEIPLEFDDEDIMSFDDLIEKIWWIFYILSTPSMESMIEEYIEDIFNDIDEFIVWMQDLKDERLPYYPSKAKYSGNRRAVKWIDTILRNEIYDRESIVELIENEIWLLHELLNYMREEM